jgi:tetratricopeptide (TPR) repeat protein
MRRGSWVAGLALCVVACAPTVQERVHEYNEDGVHLFDHRDYAHAAEEFKAALALSPADPGLLFNLGQCYDHLGQTERAEQLYQACLREEPDHAECRHALTVLLVGAGRGPDAVRLVEDWLLHQPGLAAPYAEHGWLYRQVGDPIRALKRYQQALDLDPNNPRALTEMGLLYEEMHYPERALLLYEHALEVNPRQPDLVKRVKLLREKGTGHPHPES